MICSNCNENEANVIYSENINGIKKELYLCEKCSYQLGINNIDININMPIDFSSFFAGMLEEIQTSELIPIFDKTKKIECEDCGNKFEDIINTGKFGCANCYNTFETKIDPIIKKIQGSNMHIGRIGKEYENKIEKNSLKKEKTKNEKLKDELKKAIKEERYEEAAVIRDEINKKQ